MYVSPTCCYAGVPSWQRPLAAAWGGAPLSALLRRQRQQQGTTLPCTTQAHWTMVSGIIILAGGCKLSHVSGAVRCRVGQVDEAVAVHKQRLLIANAAVSGSAGHWISTPAARDVETCSQLSVVPASIRSRQLACRLHVNRDQLWQLFSSTLPTLCRASLTCRLGWNTPAC